MTLVEIINARTVLNGITDKLPFTAAYKIARFMKDTDTAAELFDTRRKEIFGKYAEENVIPDERLPDANKEMAELGDTELEDIQPVFAADDFGTINLTTAQAYGLLGVIKN